MREPGSRCELRVNWWDGELPEEGDQLYTAAGSCYLILEFRPSRPGSLSLGRFICERLPHGSVTPGAPGAFGWAFAPRVRRPAASLVRLPRHAVTSARSS